VIIVSSGNARISAPKERGRARRGKHRWWQSSPEANHSRVSANENETRELRKQVDSLVELLGHHGVRLEPRSSMSKEPPRPAVPQSASSTSYVASETISQSNYNQNFQGPQISMSLPQMSYSGDNALPIDNNQNPLEQQPFNNNVWTASPVENVAEGIVRQSVVSPSNEASHGTLVISASGRSKYLGPSAASEWLKDVSACSQIFVQDS